MSRNALDALLSPRSVAVVGASDTPTRIGGRPIAYLKAAGFSGGIYPVNPTRESVQGLKAYPSISALPEAVDTAILALPATAIVDAVKQAAEAGIKACVVFSSGFAETGPEGAARQKELAAAARAGGLRLLGPNCLGLFDTQSRFYATFSTTLDRGFPEQGQLSIISQSGAFGSHLYFVARELGLGVRRWITTGNEADLSVAECLLYLAEDPGTHVILAYAEGVGDGPLLIRALERARELGKPVIFIKVGRSEVGAEAVTSHTAALAGSDAVFDAVLRRCGAWRAHSIEAAMDAAYALSVGELPQGNRVGLVTISGGIGVLMADMAEDLQLEVPPLPAAAQAELKALLPFAGTRNPVDITAQVFNDISLFESNLDVLLRYCQKGAGAPAADHETAVDSAITYLTSAPGAGFLRKPFMEALTRLRTRHPKAPLMLSIQVPEEMRRACEALRLPVFADPGRALAATAAQAHFARQLRRKATPRQISRPIPPPTGPLGEQQAKAMLSRAGVPLVEERLVHSQEEAIAAFEAFGGGPVVLKLASPDILHKTEIGGVILDCRDAATVARAYELLLSRAAEKAPQAKLDGILLARQLAGGVECILGMEHDPVFGPVIMLGLGGIFVEVLKDVVFSLAPVSEDEAIEMINVLQGAPLLQGARGREPLDIGALARTVAAFSDFAAAAHWAQSAEVNPLLVLPEGVVALDALIVKAQPPS